MNGTYYFDNGTSELSARRCVSTKDGLVRLGEDGQTTGEPFATGFATGDTPGDGVFVSDVAAKAKIEAVATANKAKVEETGLSIEEQKELVARIEDLQTKLPAANSRIAELEAHLAAATAQSTGKPDDKKSKSPEKP